MNFPIRIHQNDVGIILSIQCRDEQDLPIDLSQHAVDLLLYNGDTLLNDGRTACAKPDTASGIAEYVLNMDDTAETGILHGTLRLQSGASSVRSLSGIVIEVI